MADDHSAPHDLIRLYHDEIALRQFEPDAPQARAVERLEALRLQILAESRASHWWVWRRRFGSRPQSAGARGVYLWGGVGRGKTWLADLFFNSLTLRERQRRHFHQFMRDIHEQLRQMPHQEAPLERVARRLAARVRVLCLDELYVSDIADAMILGTLFETLLKHGVFLLITSNQSPAQLYPDGLQRSRFLPAIHLLQQQLDVLAVDGGIDYRLRELRRRPIYFTGPSANTTAQLQALFARLADPGATSDSNLSIQGRKVRAVRRAGDVVWFSFAVLCESSRSQNDYADIAREFHTVLLSDVPVFNAPQQDNAARRFIALVDEFYDQGVNLVLSAAARPEALYQAERLRFDFRRTTSRLSEMQTEDYLARARR